MLAQMCPWVDRRHRCEVVPEDGVGVDTGARVERLQERQWHWVREGNNWLEDEEVAYLFLSTKTRRRTIHRNRLDCDCLQNAIVAPLDKTNDCTNHAHAAAENAAENAAVANDDVAYDDVENADAENADSAVNDVADAENAVVANDDSAENAVENAAVNAAVNVGVDAVADAAAENVADVGNVVVAAANVENDPLNAP